MGSHRVRALVLLIGAATLSAARAAEAADAAANADAGRPVYLRHCSACHGVAGDGQGPLARFLPVTPRDFTTGLFRFRSVPSGSPPTDSDLERTVRRGIPSTPMPSWDRVLADGQIQAVARFVRTFAPNAGEPALSLTVPEAPPPTPEAVARGRSVYLLMQCWQCHGLGGRGDGPAAATLKDDRGRGIPALDFTRGYLKGGGGSEDVYRTLLTGLDGSPMPSYRESLVMTREAFADLSAFVGMLTSTELQALQDFIAGLPTSEQWERSGEAGRSALADGWRWDLAHYVRSLGARSPLTRYLFDDPYVTP